MRKDYIVSSSEHLGETDFVEEHWTKIWENEGGPKGQIDRVRRRDEFRMMMPYLRELPRGARVLDGGCGLGDWVIALEREGFRVTGLDLSRKTIEQLQARFPECEFRAGDIRATGIEDASVDAYFSWGVFEHFENGPQDCIREALRVLKPGGLLFVSVPLDNLRHALAGTRADPEPVAGPMRFYQYRFTVAELARELGLGGFEVLSVRPIHKPQGMLRFLQHQFGLPYAHKVVRALAYGLSRFVTGRTIGHMVLAVARRPM